MDKGLIYTFIIITLITSSTLYLYSIDKKPTIKMILPWLAFLVLLGIYTINKGTSVMDAVLSTLIAVFIPLPIWIAYVKGKFNGLPNIASKAYNLLAKLADTTVSISQGFFILVVLSLFLYFIIALSWVFGGIFGVIFTIFL